MQLNADALARQKLTPRTGEVSVPALAAMFAGVADLPEKWVVRGLEGYEIYQVEADVEGRKNLPAIVDAVLGGAAKEQIEAVRQYLNIGEKIPPACAKHILFLSRGAVNPKICESLASDICRAFPVEFKILVMKITELTGLGHVPGKAVASGVTPPSEAQ